MAAMYEFSLGTTAGNLVNIESLTTPVYPPRADYKKFAEEAMLGDGSVRGLGAPRATWHWGFLSAAQRSALRAYCAGASSQVYVRTPDDLLAFHTYRAILFWPKEEEVEAERMLDLAIEFKLIEKIV